MNITTITTVNHNVGDDFVREGILYLLEEYFGNIKAFNIHKHIPVTVRKEFEWVYSSGLTRLIDRLPRIRGIHLSKVLDSFPIIRGTDKILKADILIQCGAPVYWCHQTSQNYCANNEWYKPLILKRYIKVKNNVSFVNLGAGSCQEYYSNGSEFVNCEKCNPYIKEIHSLAKVTTVRDKLAKHILNLLNLDAPLIPCPSIFAKDRLAIKKEKSKYICLNYMHGGGHYDFGKNINTNLWEKVFFKFYSIVKNQHNCIFVCHNKKELQDVKKIDPYAKTFFSKNYIDYLKFYAQAECGIVNRIHAAFAIASFDRPSFIIGNDSRSLMTEEINLPHAFVSEVTTERLLYEFKQLLKNADKYQEIFSFIKERAYTNYMESLSVL